MTLLQSIPMPGTEIFRCYDDLGPIRVFEAGALRYLAFSDNSQQSAVNIDEPAALVFDYTQAMLVACVYFPKPKRVTLLGLGAGSLVHAFRALDSQLLIDVAELRPLVIEVAHDWFSLPRNDERLSLTVADAAEYMHQFNGETDLIFSDIYTDNGLAACQFDEDFLNDCFNALSRDGILVLNLWLEEKLHRSQAKKALADLFPNHCLACEIEHDNLIVFAFKSGIPQINDRRMQPLIHSLERRLPFTISRFVRDIHPL